MTRQNKITYTCIKPPIQSPIWSTETSWNISTSFSYIHGTSFICYQARSTWYPHSSRISHNQSTLSRWWWLDQAGTFDKILARNTNPSSDFERQFHKYCQMVGRWLLWSSTRYQKLDRRHRLTWKGVFHFNVNKTKTEHQELNWDRTRCSWWPDATSLLDKLFFKESRLRY